MANPRSSCPKQSISRVEIERNELQRWRVVLAELLIEAKLPTARAASTCENPLAQVVTCVGNFRASTIRKRVREWKKVRAFSMSLCGEPWPADLNIIMDYIRERLAEPCARTVPHAILEALLFMEKAGGVEASEQLGHSRVLCNLVSQATQDLEVDAAPKKQAPLVPLSMVCALELLVCDPSAKPFARAFAFYKLVKLWTACRFDDLCGLNPASLELREDGLIGLLERAKTSGPGKRVRHLPIFVSAKASFMASEWLVQGWKIWSAGAFSFCRDYFLALPNEDWSGVRQVMADYSDAATLSKQILRILTVPIQEDRKWVRSQQPLILMPEALAYWTEHSDRNWLNSLLAAIGVSPQERNYVGRWQVGASVDEYMRTAKRVIFGLQDRLISHFLQSEDLALRSAGLEELESHLLLREVSKVAAPVQIEKLRVPRHWQPVVPAPEKVEAFTIPEVLEEEPEPDSPYFIAIVGKQRLRRLHRRDGCGVSRLVVREAEPVWTLRGVVYDLACKHCWRPGESTVSEAEEADDSGSSAVDSDSP